jgi:hypothetical protein
VEIRRRFEAEQVHVAAMSDVIAGPG